jgi:hypothetical protein
MNKKLAYFLGFLIIVIAGVFIVLKFVNKPVNDYSSKEVKTKFSFADIMNKVSNDTASLSELKDQLVGIEGLVKKVTNDSTSTTLEIGDTTSMSSIICQIDARYKNDFSHLKPGDAIAVKGIITGYTIDTDLGFGNTVEMNYCTQLKK